MGYWIGEGPHARYIATCKWCGKEFPDGSWDGYCGDECRMKAKEARRPKQEPKPNSSSSSYDNDSHGTGLFGIIWKAIKWGAIIMIIWFVYDNYIQNDKTVSKSGNTYSTTQSNVNSETKSQSSSGSIPDANLTEIKQVAYAWSDSHNSRNLQQLSSLYAPQVNYYQSNYSIEQIKASKDNLLSKYPDFKQEISNLAIEKEASCYVITFDKKVWTDLQTEPKTYPSYLHVKMIDGSWKIITESDLVTDKNLSKKKKK